ncbi:prepilin peptidase [Roseicella sp. DB1501]|uniref:prepilin peptidase n=1 Tax=Roseicella sp. DB1501 TaxID=2730925 RepID=UPI001491BF2C|nr:prepilin peptidase [Roseicella sp. DB1501]
MQSWWLPVLAAPFIGSFLGVLIRRLPEGRPVGLARSACERCGTALAARDLLPIGSYLALGGRCRACGTAIAPFHLAVEVAALLLAGTAAALLPDDPPRLWLTCGLGWALLALAWIDWEHLILPDALTLPLIPAGLLATWWLAPAELTGHAAGAALGYLAFRGVALAYRRLRGREGLGQGDAKLMAAAGAWLGWEALAAMVLVAALLGLALAGILALRRGGLDAAEPLPFGPCLALALWLCWLRQAVAA